MGSRYDSKQGVDGIATLTHDPIAVENVCASKCRAELAPALPSTATLRHFANIKKKQIAEKAVVEQK